MKIGLLGFGTVGSGVFEQLSAHADMTVEKILLRRDRPELKALSVTDIRDITEDPEIDVVVEVIGGLEPAYDYVMYALNSGKHVVTANKLLLAYHFEELLKAAEENGVTLRFDASVGGGIPYLHNLLHNLRTDRIRSLYGIVNGTTNLILDTMQTDGSDFADVLAQAQRAGFAEADPSADIDGIDARAKLCVSASVAFGRFLRPDDVPMAGIRHITRTDVNAFRQLGYVCRLLVRAEHLENGRVCACVEPTLVPPMAPEASVRRNNNLIGFVGDSAGNQHFFGQGAGKSPTAYSVVSDLLDIRDGIPHLSGCKPEGIATVDNTSISRRYYLRTIANPGVAAKKMENTSDCYVTAPLSVERMHTLATTLRAKDPKLFFAGIRD